MTGLLKPVDRLIDGITMYRLVFYYLIGLLLVAVILSASGHIGYSPIAIALTALYLVVVCGVTNTVFARALHVPAGTDSTNITALILALIITPESSLHNVVFLTAAGGLAIASKYILAVRRKHIFNPAAIAVTLTALGATQSASWWVGNALLLPFVIAGGLLVARKLRRMRMVLVFFAAAVISTAAVNLFVPNGSVGAAVRHLLLHSSLFFLGFVMLTEPVTTPPTQAGRTWYAALVGALFPPQVHLLGLYSTPELALSVGNLFSYVISPKVRLAPVIRQKLQLAPDIVDLVLSKQRDYTYTAGQYAEVTLGHPDADSRGNRRYLTLASSPTEDNIRFGIKFYPGGSSFKRALLAASGKPLLTVSPPAGDFTLPADASRKLAFVAGGIGITPYRSMVKYLLDTDQIRDIVLFYAGKKPDEFVYGDVFGEAADRMGMRTVYIASQAAAEWAGRRGRITAESIAAELPDYQERTFYVSGPLAMVTSVKEELGTLGVPAEHIRTDYFPGYA